MERDGRKPATYTIRKEPTMQVQTEQQPEVNVIQVDQTEYNASCQKYERLANLRLRNSDTIILGGYGCFIKVSNGAFVVEYQKPHEPGTNKVLRLNRGIHKIKQIIITVHGGYITLDALEWACQQDITIYLMSYKGEVLQVLTPKQPRNVKLAYLQHQASGSDLALVISAELVKRKTQSQIDTLSRYPHLPKQAYAIDVLKTWLNDLCSIPSIERLRVIEGTLASTYFAVFNGINIRWQKRIVPTLPPHWLTITSRNSPLTKGKSARYSINPFHSCLNFALAVLEGQVLQSVVAAGLEPTCSYLHAPQYDRVINSLAHDLMEPFRPMVDAMVLSFFQKNVFKRGDFHQELSGECRMNNEELKRYVLASCRVQPIEIDRAVRWVRSALEGTHV